MLSARNVDALQVCLWQSGLLDGLNAKQAHAICTDLFWLVERIVIEAVDHAVVGIEAAAVLCAEDCLHEQRATLFASWQAQVAHPQ